MGFLFFPESTTTAVDFATASRNLSLVVVDVREKKRKTGIPPVRMERILKKYITR